MALIQKPIRIRPGTFIAIEDEVGRLEGASASSLVRGVLQDYVDDVFDVAPEPASPIFWAMVEPELWRAAVAKAKARGVTIAQVIEAIYG